MKENRRTAIKTAAAVLAGAGLAKGQHKHEKKVRPEPKQGEGPRLFSSSVTFGQLVFIAGKGAHFEGDIKAHTKHVLDEIEKELEAAGSSMDKVLKASVFLNDLNDYKAMNEVYLGRFGKEPPVRTTIAAAGGIPGNSLVEIDVIAYL